MAAQPNAAQIERTGRSTHPERPIFALRPLEDAELFEGDVATHRVARRDFGEGRLGDFADARDRSRTTRMEHERQHISSRR